MGALKSLLLVVFGLSVSVAMSILVMIHGWGLNPRSYMWIVVIGVFGQLAAQKIIALAGKK